MRFSRIKFGWSALAVILLLILNNSVWGQNKRGKETHLSFGEWRIGKKGEADSLRIDIRDHVSKRQKDLVTSGFSTFSRVSLRRLSEDGLLENEPLVTLDCTVKYDLWQEQYELARLKDNPESANVKSYADYASRCLELNLIDPAILTGLESGQNMLVASLIFDQISAKKEAKIRQWLVEQQTGIMQGLFAHMLGELKLSERIDIVVEVPRKDRPNPKSKHARGG